MVLRDVELGLGLPGSKEKTEQGHHQNGHDAVERLDPDLRTFGEHQQGQQGHKPIIHLPGAITIPMARPRANQQVPGGHRKRDDVEMPR